MRPQPRVPGIEKRQEMSVLIRTDVISLRIFYELDISNSESYGFLLHYVLSRIYEPVLFHIQSLEIGALNSPLA